MLGRRMTSPEKLSPHLSLAKRMRERQGRRRSWLAGWEVCFSCENLSHCRGVGYCLASILLWLSASWRHYAKPGVDPWYMVLQVNWPGAAAEPRGGMKVGEADGNPDPGPKGFHP